MGYKRWLRLEEVTSDDLNDYLADQVVARFPTAAARDAAIPFPIDGMASQLTDTGSLLFYSAARGRWLPPHNAAWGDLGPRQTVSTNVAAQAWLSRWLNVPLYAGRLYELTLTGTLSTFGVGAATVELFPYLVTTGAATPDPAPKFVTVLPAGAIVAASVVLPFYVPANVTAGQVGIYGTATAATLAGASGKATMALRDVGPNPGFSAPSVYDADAEAELLPADPGDEPVAAPRKKGRR